MSKVPREQLIKLIEHLDLVRTRLLLRMAEALTITIPSSINPSSNFVTPELASAFGSQLLLHHATHEEKLNKKTFEYILKYACESVGYVATLNPNPTFAGGDININGTKFSLKTQADSGIRSKSLYIQKLMEARWVRDYTMTDELANAARQRIGAHLANYNRILVLRAFSVQQSNYRYELVEVPVGVLRLITQLPNSAFSAKNRFGSSGATVSDQQGIAFRLLLDGSVEKVRIFNLRMDRCIVHADWHIPQMMAIGENDD